MLGAAWVAVGARSPVPHAVFSQQVNAPHHTDSDAISPIDATDAVVTALPISHRSSDLRLGSLWVLSGLAAGLAALCMLRRLRGSPASQARRVVLRGSVARRAPPLASFA